MVCISISCTPVDVLLEQNALHSVLKFLGKFPRPLSDRSTDSEGDVNSSVNLDYEKGLLIEDAKIFKGLVSPSIHVDYYAMIAKEVDELKELLKGLFCGNLNVDHIELAKKIALFRTRRKSEAILFMEHIIELRKTSMEMKRLLPLTMLQKICQDVYQSGDRLSFKVAGRRIHRDDLEGDFIKDIAGHSTQARGRSRFLRRLIIARRGNLNDVQMYYELLISLMVQEMNGQSLQVARYQHELLELEDLIPISDVLVFIFDILEQYRLTIEKKGDGIPSADNQDARPVDTYSSAETARADYLGTGTSYSNRSDTESLQVDATKSPSKQLLAELAVGGSHNTPGATSVESKLSGHSNQPSYVFGESYVLGNSSQLTSQLTTDAKENSTMGSDQRQVPRPDLGNKSHASMEGSKVEAGGLFSTGGSDKVSEKGSSHVIAAGPVLPVNRRDEFTHPNENSARNVWSSDSVKLSLTDANAKVDPYDASKNCSVLVPKEIVQLKFEDLERFTNQFDARPMKVGGHKIGEGSFGDVFYASMPVGGGEAREVAIKKIKQPKGIKDSQIKLNRRQFPSELLALTRWHHPNIVSLLGQCAEGPELCLVYEFVRGGSLASLLAKENANPPLWDVRLRVVRDIAQALMHMHTSCHGGLVHRDVKSANVLVTEEYGGKLADFGLSIATEDEEDPYASFYVTSAVGTRSYMPPEAFKGKVSPRIDVYAFGMVLYEVITGLPPYSATKKKDLVTFMRELERQISDLSVMNDPRAKWPVELAADLLKLARWCTDYNSKLRPSMTVVAEILEMLMRENSHDSDQLYD